MIATKSQLLAKVYISYIREYIDEGLTNKEMSNKIPSYSLISKHISGVRTNREDIIEKINQAKNI